jgi:hypothetical protein
MNQNDENTGLFNPIIKRAQLNRLPEKLGLNDIAILLFHHRYKNTIFSIIEPLNNFKSWIYNQVENGHIKIEGHTNRELCLFFRGNIKEPIIHRDEVKTCLEILDLFPLEDGCLLANWWNNSSLSDKPVIEKERQAEYAEANKKLSKRRKEQIEYLREVAKRLSIDLLDIPLGDRELLKNECLKNSNLFTYHGFDHMWDETNRLGITKVQNKEDYS